MTFIVTGRADLGGWSGVLWQLVMDYCYAISSAPGGEATQNTSKLRKEGGRGAGLLGPILDLPLVTGSLVVIDGCVTGNSMAIHCK